MYVVRMHRTIALLSAPDSDHRREYVVEVSSQEVLRTEIYSDAIDRYQDEKQKLPRQLNI